MPKLISANFVKNEAHCIERMLDTVQPYVEESYILVDEVTTDDTIKICENRGCVVDTFKFVNFSKVWNTLLNKINDKGDWTIFIAPDEIIDEEFGKMLNPLVEQIHDTEYDGVWFTRRHWADLDKKNLFEKDKIWFPDWQLRLLRNDYPRIHLVNYVHEVTVGCRKTLRMENQSIDHFNMYWKKHIDYDLDKMQQLYNRLQAEQKQDGGKNIWPNVEV